MKAPRYSCYFSPFSVTVQLQSRLYVQNIILLEFFYYAQVHDQLQKIDETDQISTMAPPPDWKTTNRTIQILQLAEEGRYGVIATVAYNIEHILGMVQAAELTHSPLIIQFFPWAITFSSGLLIRTAADAASQAKVPVAIHLDHAQDEEMIRRAADTLPFDSIMIDMSHYEKETNLAKTKELVRYCHERGIATEAEPGRIEGGEDGVMDTEGLEGSMTTMEEVSDFVDTGVDFLAPAIGNMHGENPYGSSNPNLDFER
jgi:fructose-bisphosphate aldolase, class II